MSLDDTVSILANADFFEICTGEQLRLLAFASERLSWTPGSVIHKAGEVPLGAHILVSGRLRASAEARPSAPGTTIRQPGTLIGAAALVIARPRPVHLTAVTTAETLMVPRAAFLKLAQQSSALAEAAAERIRQEMADYIEALSVVRGRIGGD